jgi:putative FmdB family regulatory protein
MPAYDYQCGGCGHQFEKFLSISRREEPKQEPCPACEVVGSVAPVLTRAPGLVASAYTNLKPPSDFKDILTRMKKGNPNSKIDV